MTGDLPGALLAAFGPDAQLSQTIEEMAELTKAICRARRAATARTHVVGHQPYALAPNDLDRIAEKVADVQFTLSQLEVIVGPERMAAARRVTQVWALLVLRGQSRGEPS